MKQLFMLLNLGLLHQLVFLETDTLEHIEIRGLYPCGEGAGYAGGIISAAIDGQKCAIKCSDL